MITKMLKKNIAITKLHKKPKWGSPPIVIHTIFLSYVQVHPLDFLGVNFSIIFFFVNKLYFVVA